MENCNKKKKTEESCTLLIRLNSSCLAGVWILPSLLIALITQTWPDLWMQHL